MTSFYVKIWNMASFDIEWRRLIFLTSDVSSFLVENRRQFILKNSKRHYSSITTIFVKIRQEWHFMSFDVIRSRKNMTNIIRRHSTFVKWLNLTYFSSNFVIRRHSYEITDTNLHEVTNTINYRINKKNLFFSLNKNFEYIIIFWYIQWLIQVKSVT